MNRVLFYLLVVAAFACVQGVPLHGHIDHVSDSFMAHDHEAMHVHSHAIDPHLQDLHEHSEAIEVDLLGISIATSAVSLSTVAVLTTLWSLVFVVLWVCIQRSPPPVPLLHFGPPPLLRPSPRAPPA
jgi:hypothetical protein